MKFIKQIKGSHLTGNLLLFICCQVIYIIEDIQLISINLQAKTALSFLNSPVQFLYNSIKFCYLSSCWLTGFFHRPKMTPATMEPIIVATK